MNPCRRTPPTRPRLVWRRVSDDGVPRTVSRNRPSEYDPDDARLVGGLEPTGLNSAQRPDNNLERPAEEAQRQRRRSRRSLTYFRITTRYSLAIGSRTTETISQQS